MSQEAVQNLIGRAVMDKAWRDTILGHSLKEMDAYYLKPSDDGLHKAMDRYTGWLDEQIADAFASVAQNVAQASQKDNKKG